MTIKRRDWLVLAASAAFTRVGWSQGLDHRHAAWSQLLSQHVVLLRNGQASEVRYAGFAAQRDDLRRYLSSLSGVTRAEFDAFTKAQQMAFFMNAYNAFTIELVLTRYPNLKSIKDLGNLLSSPWKLRWIKLLGRLEVSRIFDWYADDFRLGHKGIDSLQRFVAMHAPLLADKEAERTRLQSPQVVIHFLDYDWRLNQIGAAA